MQCLTQIFVLIYFCTSTIYTQLLYFCNFDNGTIATSCLIGDSTNGMLVANTTGILGNQPPVQPFSDVTSSLKPTNNGEVCQLPYKVGTYTWDMYFCNNGFCPTASNLNSSCKSGKFGHFNFGSPRPVRFRLDAGPRGINGINQQCLIYYYYLPKINGTEQNIKVFKKERSGNEDQIDMIGNNPLNGWNRHLRDFNAIQPEYEIYFEFEKTGGAASPTSIIAVDEISIYQGPCSNIPTIPTTTMTVSISTVPETTTTTTTETSSTTTKTTTTTTEATTKTTTTTTEATTKTTTTTTSTTSTIATTTETSTITILTITTIATTKQSTIITSVQSSIYNNVTTITSSSSLMPSTILSTINSTGIFTKSTPTIAQMTSTSSFLNTTITIDEKPSPESVKVYIVVLATVIPASTAAAIILFIWLKKFLFLKNSKPLLFQMKKVAPAPR